MQALKGQTENEWANIESMYGWFAYAFGWTPTMVDNIPHDRLTYIMTVYSELKQKENTIK